MLLTEEEYQIDTINDARWIPLTRGKYAIVDNSDYECVMAYKWFALRLKKPNKETFYAARNKRLSVEKTTLVLMHREIIGNVSGMLTDHINHNGLDNRRTNLRVCTITENNRNRQKTIGISKYKGVFWHKKRNCWVAQISQNNKTIYLGDYKDEAKAAKTYDAKAKELFGEFAHVNFPSPTEQNIMIPKATMFGLECQEKNLKYFPGGLL